MIVRVGLHHGVIAKINLEAQLLESETLEKVRDKMRLVGLDVLRGESWHCRASPIVEARAVHADQQPCIVVGSHYALDAPLVKRDVFLCWNGHEVVRSKCLGVDLRQHFPFVPTVVMLCCRQTKGFKGFGTVE